LNPLGRACSAAIHAAIGIHCAVRHCRKLRVEYRDLLFGEERENHYDNLGIGRCLDGEGSGRGRLHSSIHRRVSNHWSMRQRPRDDAENGPQRSMEMSTGDAERLTRLCG